MKKVILVLVGAGAAAFLSPVRAQTISQPSGCVAGTPCQTATLAVGGASLGGNALAVGGTTSLGGAVTLNGFNMAGVGAISVGGATLGSNVFAATGDAQVSGQFVAFSNITTGAATRFQFSGRSALSSPADGQLTVSNNGSTNAFTVTAGTSGLATFGAGVTVTGVASVGSLSSGGNLRATTDAGLITIGAANDVIISRKGAGIIQHGDADTVSPVAQTITAQSVSAGTSNAAAPNLTIDVPKGTGTGAGGSFIVRVAPAATTGSAQNAMATALTIDSTKLATFAAGVNAGGTITTSIGGLTVPGNITSTSGTVIASAAGSLSVAAHSSIFSGTDGTFQMTNNAGTGFTALNLGPATSSFPRIAVSGAGVNFQLGDGSAGTALAAGTVTASLVRATPVTVGAISTCTSGIDGARSFVTDATATAFASAVTGGGSNHVPVYCDGSGTPTWKVG